jgi:hypothetical protein
VLARTARREDVARGPQPLGNRAFAHAALSPSSVRRFSSRCVMNLSI